LHQARFNVGTNDWNKCHKCLKPYVLSYDQRSCLSVAEDASAAPWMRGCRVSLAKNQEDPNLQKCRMCDTFYYANAEGSCQAMTLQSKLFMNRKLLMTRDDTVELDTEMPEPMPTQAPIEEEIQENPTAEKAGK